MSQIYKISSNLDVEDDISRQNALSEVQNISDLQLRSIAMIPSENLAGPWKNASLLAHAELARRDQLTLRRLTRRSTFWTGTIAVFGVVVGALLADWLEDGDLRPSRQLKFSEEKFLER
ncbi:hypothetical protein [Sulfitobacter sp.]|uniref:hypothetical protein n=1 Tax=Sulfitobacter sp. TaxID=1903071 RepID=UPI003563B702